MKKLASLLLLFSLLLTLCACNTPEGESATESATEEESLPETGGYLIANSEEALYGVCYPEGDSLLCSAANVIAAALKAATGAEISVSSQESAEGNVIRFCVDELSEGASAYIEDSGVIVLAARSSEEAYCLAQDFAQALAACEKDGVVYLPLDFFEALTASFASYRGALRIMSQNLRCADDGEGKTVVERAARFWQLVAEYQPDIIGTQETTAQWNGLIEANLGEEYAMVGVSRNGTGDKWDEWNTLLYRKDRFTLVDSGTFWLSETPDVPSTVAEGILNRICTWAVLEDKQTGERFTMANTHLDHTADERHRMAQVAVLCEFLEEMMEEYPVYLTGDFNATSDSETYWEVRALLDDAREDAVADLSAVDFTYHGYGKTESLIDFCFYNCLDSAALSVKILDNQYDGYVSDHYAVLAVLVPLQ